MKRGIYYDYGNGKGDIVIQKLRSEKIMDTIIWIDNQQRFEQYCKNEKREPLRLPDYDWFHLREGHIKDYKYSGAAKDIKEDLFKEFYHFLLSAGREDIKSYANLHAIGDNHQYADSSIYSLQNIFFILVDFFANMLKKNNIEIVYFNNIPHDGADIALYLVAKKLNIKTIMACACVSFPDKFFYYYDYNEFGNFENYPLICEIEPYHIENKDEVTPLYVQDVSSEKDISMVPKNILITYMPERCKSKFKKFAMKVKLFLRLLKPKKYTLKKIYEDLSYTLSFLDYLKYKENLKKLEVDEVDYNKKYVFFALHMQPECTTSAFGGKYNDQLLAIEALSDLIPDDWLIYVKEHYAQNELMRDPVFFQRLSGIKKVVLVSLKNSTYELVKHSQFASTITGTIGLEAICGGKKVLFFGRTYYNGLPGAFKYNEKLTLDEILNYKIDQNLLEEKIAILKAKMLDGVIDSDLQVYSPHYNEEQNMKNVINSLSKIL